MTTHTGLRSDSRMARANTIQVVPGRADVGLSDEGVSTVAQPLDERPGPLEVAGDDGRVEVVVLDDVLGLLVELHQLRPREPLFAQLPLQQADPVLHGLDDLLAGDDPHERQGGAQPRQVVAVDVAPQVLAEQPEELRLAVARHPVRRACGTVALDLGLDLLQVAVLRQPTQGAVDRARVDAGPLVDVPRQQLTADHVAVHRLEHAREAEDKQLRR